MDSLTILAIADTHHVGIVTPGMSDFGPDRPPAAEWVRRAVAEACRVHCPDAIALMGDLVDDGDAPDTEALWRELAEAACALNVPVVVAPGNHDRHPQKLLRAFDDHLGSHHINGYNLYTFSDAYAADEVATRPQETIDRFLAEAVGPPVIALQHNPIHPPVDCSGYPFMLTNTDAVTAAYEQAQVVLSVSGHYHDQTGPVQYRGVDYLSCAALVLPPFPFYLITLSGRDAAVNRLDLRMPAGSAVVDCHTHTHFGYCAVDVHPGPTAERARKLGLSGVACVEHAAQVYLTPEEFWGKRHIDDPAAIRRARDKGTDRMGAFRREMFEFRSPFLQVGLEVECDCDGKLNLLEEDREGWDLLLGAVHWLPSDWPADTPSQISRSFMRVIEQIVPSGVDILAHPFRFAQHALGSRAADLYRPVARILHAHGVAAEINLHNVSLDPEFFRICAEEGVRLTAGSDAHSLYEVGDLHPHLRLLRDIGLRPEDLWCGKVRVPS